MGIGVAVWASKREQDRGPGVILQTHLFQNLCHIRASLDTEHWHRESYIRAAPFLLELIGKFLLKLLVDCADEGIASFGPFGGFGKVVLELRKVGLVVRRNEQHHVKSIPTIMLKRKRQN